MGWSVYALFNREEDKIYIGQTSNLERRVWEHNEKLGDHFTAKVRGEWTLAYKEEVKSRAEALKRERQLKNFKGRQFIKNEIHSSVAQW